MSVVSALTSAASRAAVELYALREVRQAGMFGLEPPQRTARVVRALARYGALGAGLPIAALRDPHRTGIVDERGQLTFEELDRRSNALANRWRALGAGAGTGIGILCRN